MSSLLRKEFRELRPFVLLGVFLLVLDILEWLTEQLDMQPLGLNIGDTSEALGVLMFFIAFAAGTGLLVREMDDRTLAFLDGLPVSRARIFGTKVVAAAGVLLLYPAGHLLMLVVQHLISRQSLDHAFHGPLLWQAGAMICVVTGTGLAFGLLLGYLRSLCWLMLGLLILALVTVTHFIPPLSVLNPVNLMSMRMVGVDWQVPVTPLLTQLVLMGGGLLLSLGIFVSGQGGVARRLQQWLSRPGASAFLTFATIGVCIAALVVFALLSAGDVDRAGGKKPPVAKFADSPLVSERTARYSFSYYTQQAEQAQSLMREADRIHAQVAALLGAEDGARIDVDLTGSQQNTEGTAFHDRIRMHLGRDPLKVLAHETAHVLAHRLAGGERDREFPKMSALNEGLATWVHNQVAANVAVTDTQRFQAALVSRRHVARPEQLTDMDAFARNSDISLRYPLGAVLVDSLVARHGPDAPKKLLLALANPDFPRSLAGAELWHAAFQAAGFDLAATFNDMSRRMQDWEAEFADRIAALPRPRLSLDYKPGQLGVSLRWNGQMPEGWGAVARIRPREDSPLDQYMTLGLGGGAVAWISRSRAVAGQLCFQPGVSAGEVSIFETWSCVPVEPDPAR